MQTPFPFVSGLSSQRTKDLLVLNSVGASVQPDVAQMVSLASASLPLPGVGIATAAFVSMYK